MNPVQQYTVPSLIFRIWAVCYRHIKVYISNLGNMFPPIIEPVVVLIGIGLGLGKYIGSQIDNIPYIQFLIPALAADVAMWTSTFESTYGTFIRLNFKKIYQPMASTSVNVEEIILGELLFNGIKGGFFASLVIIEMVIFGYLNTWLVLIVPLIGFLAGILFGAMGLIVTSLIKSMDTLNFYISGIITPMFFISGTFFPINELPKYIDTIAWYLPLTHIVTIMRQLTTNKVNSDIITHLAWVTFFIVIFSYLAVIRIRKKIII